MKQTVALPAAEYVAHRRAFAEQMEQGSIAVFHSSYTYPASADAMLKYKQDTDMLYFTGIAQEQTTLLLFPDATDEAYKEVLFIRKTNPTLAIWEGHKYTKEEAKQRTGIETIYWAEEMGGIFDALMTEAETIYLTTNEHLRATKGLDDQNTAFAKKVRQEYPAHRVAKASPILHRLRSIKSEAEIALMQKACEITEKGFRKVLSSLKEGVWEYELEADYISEFTRNGSEGFGYEPIIASGIDSCTLHYLDNNKRCEAGGLVLMDVGAAYGFYNADMTRTVPVDGRYTPRQKQVYDAVLRVKEYANQTLRPGNFLKEYHRLVGECMQEELLSLGLITKEDVNKSDKKMPAYRKYFMHGTSHFIGLDVHDYGLWREPIRENMAFTIEPGIYIPDEGFGIRLEDNYVIGEKENLNLMKSIPIQTEEIESLILSE